MLMTDNRFEIINRAKKALLDSTNIEQSPDEMKVLDNFLFRCWQMDWLDKYDERKTNVGEWIPCSERLPEETGEYLLQIENGDMFNGNFDEDIGEFGVWKSYYENMGFTGSEWCEFADVIAWMPLPEPFEESEE